MHDVRPLARGVFKTETFGTCKIQEMVEEDVVNPLTEAATMVERELVAAPIGPSLRVALGLVVAAAREKAAEQDAAEQPAPAPEGESE